MSARLTREQLYDLVWSEPLRTLAPRFDISDVALKKTCARANIPVPERGYWNKKLAGKDTYRPPLPSRSPGMDEDAFVGGGRQYWWREQPTEEELLGPLPPEPSFIEPIETVREKMRAKIGKITNRGSLSPAHSTIARLFDDDEKRREKQRATPYPSLWDAPIFDNPLQRRRLRILNSLFRTVEKLGSKSFARGREATEIEVTVGRQHVGMRFDEMKSGRGKAGTSATATPALRLSILRYLGSDTSRVSWCDDEAGKIEDRLAEIAAEVIVSGELQYRESCFRTYEWRVQRKAQLIEEIHQREIEAERLKREKKAAEEKKQIDRLLTDAAARRQADEIRAYVAAVRDSNRSRGSAGSDLENWCTWALSEADRIDPIVSGKVDMNLLNPDSEG